MAKNDVLRFKVFDPRFTFTNIHSIVKTGIICVDIWGEGVGYGINDKRITKDEKKRLVDGVLQVIYDAFITNEDGKCYTKYEEREELPFCKNDLRPMGSC